MTMTMVLRLWYYVLLYIPVSCASGLFFDFVLLCLFAFSKSNSKSESSENEKLLFNDIFETIFGSVDSLKFFENKLSLWHDSTFSRQ